MKGLVCWFCAWWHSAVTVRTSLWPQYQRSSLSCWYWSTFGVVLVKIGLKYFIFFTIWVYSKLDFITFQAVAPSFCSIFLNSKVSNQTFVSRNFLDFRHRWLRRILWSHHEMSLCWQLSRFHWIKNSLILILLFQLLLQLTGVATASLKTRKINPRKTTTPISSK